MDRGAWEATVHRVAKSRTRLSDFTFTFHFHVLEKEMATHSSTLAWKIPWTEEPGRLQSMGLQRVRHDIGTAPPPHSNMKSTAAQYNTEKQWPPLQHSRLENPMDRGAWWAAVQRVAKSRTRLSDFTSLFVLRLKNPSIFFSFSPEDGR